MIIVIAGVLVVGCKRSPPPQEHQGPQDPASSTPAHSRIRYVIADDCKELSAKIDQIYAKLNHCVRDSDCMMFTKCDGINRNEDTAELVALMQSRGWVRCRMMHGACTYSDAAACKQGRCVGTNEARD